MVSIILPVFNCSEQLRTGLPLLHEVLRSLDRSYELIIVNDGSADPSVIAGTAAESGCIYLENQTNLGKGAAVKKGVSASKGDLVIFMDGDFPFDLSVIPSMLREFENNETDIVIGDRSLPGSKYPSMGVARRIGSKVLSGVFTKFILDGITDSQCGIKGFRSKVAKTIFEKVKLEDFSFDVEVLFIAKIRKYRIVHLPVTVSDQDLSSVKVMRDGSRMIAGLLRIMKQYLTGQYKP